jgi:hypothetical protein
MHSHSNPRIAALRLYYTTKILNKKPPEKIYFLLLGCNAQSFQSSHCFPAPMPCAYATLALLSTLDTII